jgi:hypothetical protein
MYELSVLIPSRSEMFLSRTIKDVLEHKEGSTEIIVVCDGEWPIPPIEDHPDVTLIYHSRSIGQRAATNEAARLSTAKFVMKLDAHCSVDQGFDVKLMKDCQPHWTMVPQMRNLHAFDWKCDNCEHRAYQGPYPVKCEKCKGERFERVIVWQPRAHTRNCFMRFDRELHFQYWRQFKSRPEARGHLVPTMSILGACFMMTRERYWELEGLDERHGSWGQMGTEIACKTWLTDGELICSKKTWFAHMFRTQKGFTFPYPNPGSQVARAREHSKWLWKEGNWPKAKHSLSWMINKFAPVPDWSEKKGIIYYTDNRLDKAVAEATRNQLARVVGEMEIVSVSLKPLDFGRNIVLDLERGYLTMFKQILAGLEASTADVIFFCEHDVLYSKSHFEFEPVHDNIFYYNENIWKVHWQTGQALFYYCKQTSGLCAYRELLLKHYRKRVEIVERDGFSRRMGFEPGTHGRKERVDDYKAERYMSTEPNIDIRHDKNLTPSRWSPDQFRNKRYAKGWKMTDEIPGWGTTKGRFPEFLEKVRNGQANI